MNRPVLKLSYNAPVTLTFALLALTALVLDHFTGGWTTVHLFSVYRCSLSDPLAFFRFFGHVLGHSGIQHFMGNMLFILLLGPTVEDRFGSWTPCGPSWSPPLSPGWSTSSSSPAPPCWVPRVLYS